MSRCVRVDTFWTSFVYIVIILVMRCWVNIQESCIPQISQRLAHAINVIVMASLREGAHLLHERLDPIPDVSFLLGALREVYTTSRNDVGDQVNPLRLV